jgi:uncharacterized LabA/DUF88 family protein
MPPLKKMMVFVDGENLTMRYQSMLSKELSPNDKTVHEPDVFVWHPNTIMGEFCEIIRAIYYTYVVGDENRVVDVQRRIKNLKYILLGTESYPKLGNLFPRVFKKLSRSAKTKGVDISITVDILKYTYQKNIDIVYLVGGDGDYLPVIQEVMGAGVQLHLAALSDGRSPSLPNAVDRFLDLDDIYFKS